jgi:hypothetical protein
MRILNMDEAVFKYIRYGRGLVFWSYLYDSKRHYHIGDNS